MDNFKEKYAEEVSFEVFFMKISRNLLDSKAKKNTLIDKISSVTVSIFRNFIEVFRWLNYLIYAESMMMVTTQV